MSQRYPTSLVAAYDQRVHHCRLAPTRSTWCTLGAGAGRLTMWSVGHHCLITAQSSASPPTTRGRSSWPARTKPFHHSEGYINEIAGLFRAAGNHVSMRLGLDPDDDFRSPMPSRARGVFTHDGQGCGAALCSNVHFNYRSRYNRYIGSVRPLPMYV